MIGIVEIHAREPAGVDPHDAADPRPGQRAEQGLVALAAAAATAAFFLRKKDKSDLWDTASSWGETAADKAGEVAETVVHAAESATNAARDAAKK